MSAYWAAMLLQTLVHTTEPGPAPVPSSPTERTDSPEVKAYFAARDANADVENAFASAKISGKTVVVVMGANWCHDSVGLAGWLEMPRFANMMRDRYEIVYVDVGTPQTGEGRNLDIAKRFGIKKVRSSPLLFLASPEGQLLNSKKDALAWRNAASRSEDDIFRYFAEFTPAVK